MESVGRRGRTVQEARQAGVAGEDPDVLDALAARGLDEHAGVELVELAVPAVSHPQPELVADDGVQPEGEECLRNQRQTGVRGEIHRS